MKTKLLFITFISLFMAGCGSLLHKDEPTPTVITQPVYGVAPSGQLVQIGTTNLVANVGQYQLNTNLVAGIGAAQAILGAAAAVPSPASPFLGAAAAGLTGLSALLGLYARKKSGELTLSNAALAATTIAIETATEAARLKEAARQAATANGSQDYLHDQVKNL